MRILVAILKFCHGDTERICPPWLFLDGTSDGRHLKNIEYRNLSCLTSPQPLKQQGITAGNTVITVISWEI